MTGSRGGLLSLPAAAGLKPASSSSTAQTIV